MSMIKLTYSSDISSTVGVGGEIVKSASELGKQAATIFHMEYEEMKPPKGMTGIHLVALGDSEAYPMNRNGDLFPKEACVKYHPTFVKHGCVYQHHRNKDPKTQGIGQIKASAYNPDMHRIELYIWADNEKAREHLERLEKTGEVPFSMACRVPHDRCSVCGAIRERPGDDKECDHIKFELGKLAEDGTQIGTYNDEPTWFDISFVGRPADRIAWNLKVASSMPEEIKLVSSVKQAEVEGYVLPDDLAIESDISKRKLSVMKKLADCYGKCASWLAGETKPEGHDRYVFELRKLAGARLDDGTLSMMRELDPNEAFSALGDAGVLMDVGSFLKYAFGPEYGIVEKYIPHVENAVPDVIKEAVDTSSCAEICNCSKFDPRPAGLLERPVPNGVQEALLKSAAAGGFGIYDATTNILEVVADGREPSFYINEKVAESTEVDPQVARKLAKRYAMYKVAGICAIMDGKCGGELDEDDLVFVAAAQDLRK